MNCWFSVSGPPKVLDFQVPEFLIAGHADWDLGELPYKTSGETETENQWSTKNLVWIQQNKSLHKLKQVKTGDLPFLKNLESWLIGKDGPKTSAHVKQLQMFSCISGVMSETF